ncbi:MAG: diguanylate cyclase [Janthinobacterium lividum]
MAALLTIAETIATLETRLMDAVGSTEKDKALKELVWELRAVDPQRALSLSEDAVTDARAAGNRPSLALSLCLVGICMTVLSRHEEAREALDESLPLSRHLADLHTEALCLHYIGTIHYFLAEHSDAIENVMASLQIREDQQDWEGLGAGFNILGNVQFALCDYGLALDWYKRSLEARERAGDQQGVAASLGNLGNVYAERGDLTEALHFHQRSLDQSVRIGNTALEISSLCNLGGDYVDLGRYEEGIEACRRSIMLGETLEDWEKVTVALTSMGYAYGKTQRQSEALGCYARALEIARSVQNQKLAAHTLFSTGEILGSQGKLEEARGRLSEAFALAQAIGARRTAFQASQMLAEVCKRLGHYAAALGHYETFRRLEKEVFTEEADDRAKALVIKMDVEHHRREAESLAEINTALQEANSRLEALATTDPLTRLPNHRNLVAALDAETARARRGGSPCALLFLDIDHFKHFNDTYGHPIGDAILVEFADCVHAGLREVDTVGRWGGEEFLVLLPDTSAEEALQVGERIRFAVAAHPLAAIDGLHMTCSIGAASCPPQEASRHDLILAADKAMYTAKRQGRNQVCGSSQLESVSAADVSKRV